VIVASLAPLQAVSMILVAVGATAVVLTRDVQRQMIGFAGYQHESGGSNIRS
jgi:hypothetical protein